VTVSTLLREDAALALAAPQHTFVRYWLPVLAYVAMIFTLSAQPHLQVPFHFQNADKVVHMSEYCGLGLLMVRALRTLPRLRSAAAAGLVAITIGVGIGSADELFQSTVPGRDSDVFDLIADSIGVTLSQTLYLWVKRP
jgi:VanZ family protein